MPNKTKQNHTTRKQKMLTTTIQITNNPPHTPPTPNTPQNKKSANQGPIACEPNAQTVLNVNPTACLLPRSLHPCFPLKNTHAPTPTTHTKGSELMRAQETHTKHTRVSLMRIPKKSGLPRKEVIQPHLPVRLPCYDFVPIANPTFDHSPQNG